MAEEQKYIKSTWTAPTGEDYRFYSTDGNLKTAAQFDAAIAQFESEAERVGVENATTPTGFTALKVGSGRDVARGVFEAANQPIQQAARSINESIPQYPVIGRAGSPAEPNPIAGIINLVKKGVPYLAEQVNTPERAAVTGVLTALGIGPVGKALRQTSGGLPTFLRSLGGATGAGVAGEMTGSSATESADTPFMQRKSTEPLLTALSIVGSESIVGLISKGFGLSLSQRANQQVMDDVITSLKKDVPSLSLSGNQGIIDYASTKQGYEKIIRAGIKGVKLDGEELSRTFISDINSVMPRSMGKVTARHLEKALADYNNEAIKILDNLGDEKVKNTSIKAIDEIKDKITQLVTQEFSKSGELNPGQLAGLVQTWEKYKSATDKLYNAAEIFSTLRQAGPSFDAVKLQQVIKSKVAANNFSNSVLSDDIINAAFRGGSVGQTDKRFASVLGSLPRYLGGPALGRLPLGTHFTGTVQRTSPYIPTDIATNAAIVDFLKREK